MRKLTKPKWQIINKFIHEWLPLETRYHVQSLSEQQLCPSCHLHPETAEHFLQCTNPNQQQLWADLLSQVQKLSFCYNLPPSIHDHLAQGIQHSMNLTNLDPPMILEQPSYYQHQWSLGWKQLFYGRYLLQWVSAMHQQNQPINGQHFITKVIILMWTQILSLWSIQNQHLHPPMAANTDCSRLHNIIQQIIHDAQQDPHLEALVGHIQIDQLMSRPTKQIHQFINRSHDHIRDHNQAVETRAQLNNQDIRSFFERKETLPLPRTADKNLLQPP